MKVNIREHVAEVVVQSLEGSDRALPSEPTGPGLDD